VPLCAVVIACDRIFVYNEAYVVKYVHNTERIGCRIYKYFIYSLAWISFLTPFILTGVLLGPEHGAWVGMLVAVILTCVYGLLGDRLFLSYVEARDLNRERRLKNKINNYDTFSHEFIHIYQYYDFNVFNTYLTTTLKKFRFNSKTFDKLSNYLYYDLQASVLEPLYFLQNQNIDCYYDNFFENEAGYYSNTIICN
jgi:hypothetical protein